MSTVTLEGVTKAFGATNALDDVDLTVAGGHLTAVLGPSGCGKTTLLRVVAGFVRPDAGTVTVGGATVEASGTHVAPERRGVAIVPQEGALFPHLDVAANVAFGLPGRRRDRATAGRVAEMLALIGLEGHGDRRPDELSGGQQQRVALARALAPSPGVVVLDEPFSALDAGLRAQVRTEVRGVLRAIGATAVIVTHDQEEALSMADSVAVMDRGRVLMHGSPAEVYQRPADLVVARFVGDLVELPGTKAGATVETALGVLPLHGTAEVPDGPVLAALRPEQIRVDGRIERHGHRAHVDDVVFQGHDSIVRLTLTGSRPTLRLAARSQAPLRPGDDVAVRVIGPALAYPR
ncbi:iron(III) transport system ATP-binding protein [Humibacillus xanthopallidus]|uniref:ABC-type quaternary amine transporter n=1 Tax=Humibacillus xanthopallidus TaxID=412689 RepID=A0A543PTD7_9MICO|nr:ABC transporter ATP-binding protein [Humibacillus xanthopallidus]TQN47348.1 iron(III) transport system ATP-binding protein [Humibacillus xanthopallidus]